MPEEESGRLPTRHSQCSRRCRSSQHADLVSSAITKTGDAELVSYLSWLCSNAASGTDSVGRSPLHVAASCGRRQLLEWLVEVHAVSLDTRDQESGMTALQRALFYGRLDCVRTLLLLGASPHAADHADMSVYDAAHADRLPLVELSGRLPCQPYVWGSNPWFSIGVDGVRSAKLPQPLDVFRRAGVWVKQVAMTKFHTVFVTQGGHVYTCGHGIGGRLGHGDEDSVLTPKKLRCVKGEHCVQVALSADHTVLLMENGTVWTCGLNQACQLGHSPPPQQLTVPRLVEWSRGRADRVTGISAARYHTVLWNVNSLYCMGFNGGQLGQHKDENSEKRFIVPRKVTMLDRDAASGTRLTHVDCSDGATAVATAAGDVFLLTQYRCRRVSSRMLNLRQLRVSGGALDAAPSGHRLEREMPLRLLILSAAGHMFIWHQDHPAVMRCEMGLRRELSVADAVLDKHGLVLVCESGQAYTGTVTLPKQAHDEHGVGPQSATATQRPGSRRAGWWTGRRGAQVRLTRLPHVHRAVAVTCDGTGANAAVVQCDPRAALVEVPQVSPSDLRCDLARLLRDADEKDAIHDIVLQAGQTRFPCHRYLLAAGSSELRRRLAGCGDTLRLEVPPAALHQLLLFLYTGNCDLTRPGPTDFRLEPTCDSDELLRSQHQQRKGKTREKAVQPVQVVRDVSKKLGVHALHKRLEGVRLTGGRIEVPREYDASPSPLILAPSDEPSLSDITILSEDGTVLAAHKCVLAARLEYFNAMLGSSWAESASSASVRLPMSATVLSLLVRYCYTDEALLQAEDHEPLQTDDVHLLCSLLAAADHFMAARLKQMCEVALSRQLTLKNVVEMMEFSVLYAAHQLKTTCMQFVCLNLAAVIENRSLDPVSDEVMDELTRYYQDVNPVMRRRHIRPSAESPCLEHVLHVHQTYPVRWDEALLTPQSDEVRARPPPRRRPGRGRTGSGSESAASPAVRITPLRSVASLDAASEKATDVSGLVEPEPEPTPASVVPEFTLVTRKRSRQPATSPAAAPPPPSRDTSPTATRGRYIPGMTLRTQPAAVPDPTHPAASPDPTHPPHPAAVRDPTHPADVPDRTHPAVLLDLTQAAVVPGSTHAAAVPDPTHPANSPDATHPATSPDPILIEAFPALTTDGSSSLSRVEPSLCTDRRRQSKKAPSKGRRGRVLCLSEGQPARPAAANTAGQKVAARPSQPAWHRTHPDAGLLADIMAEEAAAADIMSEEAAVSAPSLPDTSLPGTSSPGTSLPGTSAPGTSTPGTSLPGTSAPGTSPPAGRPGWLTGSASADQSTAASLSDIIRQERGKLHIRRLMSNKSLALIQIEERATQELLELYDCPDVKVSVTRQLVDTAEPQWNLPTR